MTASRSRGAASRSHGAMAARAGRLQSVMLMVNELSSATRFYTKGLGLPVLHTVRQHAVSMPSARRPSSAPLVATCRHL